MERLRELSAFFPAYNERANLERMVASLDAVLPQLSERYEIVVVDDGSSDGTGELARALSERYPHLRLVRHARNLGYGAAVRSGIQACRYRFVFFTDGDCQFDVRELSRLVPYISRYAIVAGYRARRMDFPVRKLYARGWGLLVRLLLGVRARDINCAFKLFQAELFKGMDLVSSGAMINAEIFWRAAGRGRSLYQVPVSHYPRTSGRQTGGSPRVVLRAFWELARLRFSGGPR